MVYFEADGERFMYRVTGVCVLDGRVLVHQFEGADDFYVLPGGRVEIREPAIEAIAREMHEELGCEVRVGRLLWIIDNLFRHKGVDFHELGLFFEIELPDGCVQASGEPWTATEVDGTKLFFQWKTLDEIARLDLKPSLLKELLLDLPEQPVYLVHRDRG
jgi:ADP-ribose pyrophosphatase YjhB (NUDIX family)